MLARIVEAPIDVAAVRAEVSAPGNGAVLVFHGVVRNRHAGHPVERIRYHAYRPLAERELARLVIETRERFDLADVAVVHRIGEVLVGEDSLLVAVGSPHRQAAFEAGLWLIEELKRRLPIWKQEFGPDGDHWVEGVLPGPPQAGGERL
jgi:molybdopterin synthase catalytic subunit